MSLSYSVRAKGGSKNQDFDYLTSEVDSLSCKSDSDCKVDWKYCKHNMFTTNADGKINSYVHTDIYSIVYFILNNFKKSMIR